MPARTSTRVAGAHYEARALKLLRKAGLKPLARNFNTRFGELDLVMRDGEDVVFVEVRYRRSRSHGGSALSVDRHKQARLVRAASLYLQAHPALASRTCRFDVVALEGDPEQPSADWHRAAFEAD